MEVYGVDIILDDVLPFIITTLAFKLGTLSKTVLFEHNAFVWRIFLRITYTRRTILEPFHHVVVMALDFVHSTQGPIQNVVH